jgi:hypothetical protein
MCQRCNNARSQPFDYAYTALVVHLNERATELLDNPFFSWPDLYGRAWKTQHAHALRYLAKHLACHLAQNGFACPTTLRQFPDGNTDWSPLLLHIDLRLDILAMHLANDDNGSLWLGRIEGQKSISTGAYTEIYSHLGTGPIRLSYYQSRPRWVYGHESQRTIKIERGFNVDPLELFHRGTADARATTT